MTSYKSNTARATVSIASVSALLTASLIFSAVAPAQSRPEDSRWQPYLGCWVPEETTSAVGANAVSGAVSNTMVCLVPVLNSPSVDIATITNKIVVNRERITATGEQVSKTVETCPGWESAQWSADGRRVFIRSEFACGNELKVKGSGVIGLSTDGNLVQVLGSTVGKNAGSRVLHYHPADVALAPNSVISDSSRVETVTSNIGFTQQAMRAQAGTRTDAKGLLDVSKHVDEQVAQTWLGEVGVSANVNAKSLVELADAGMPPALTDLMVAMANPERFQIMGNTAAGSGIGSTTRENRPVAISAADQACRYDLMDPAYDLGRSTYSQYACLSRYGGAFGYPFGYMSGWGFNSYYGNRYGYNGYGGNYYYGNQPIVIVTRPAGGDVPLPSARAVKGGGYTQSGGSSSSGSSTPRTTVNPSSGGSSSQGSSSSGSSSGSSGGDSGARTAKPRPPGGH